MHVSSRDAVLVTALGAHPSVLVVVKAILIVQISIATIAIPIDIGKSIAHIDSPFCKKEPLLDLATSAESECSPLEKYTREFSLFPSFEIDSYMFKQFVGTRHTKNKRSGNRKPFNRARLPKRARHFNPFYFEFATLHLSDITRLPLN